MRKLDKIRKEEWNDEYFRKSPVKLYSKRAVRFCIVFAVIGLILSTIIISGITVYATASEETKAKIFTLVIEHRIVMDEPTLNLIKKYVVETAKELNG